MADGVIQIEGGKILTANVDLPAPWDMQGKIATADECCCCDAPDCLGFACVHCPTVGTPDSYLLTFAGITLCTTCFYVGDPGPGDRWVKLSNLALDGAGGCAGQVGAGANACVFGTPVVGTCDVTYYSDNACTVLTGGPAETDIHGYLTIAAPRTYQVQAWVATGTPILPHLFYAEFAVKCCDDAIDDGANTFEVGDCGNTVGGYEVCGYGGTVDVEPCCP